MTGPVTVQSFSIGAQRYWRFATREGFR